MTAQTTSDNSNNQPPAGEPARPDWLPEKFKTPQDLAKSYSELEKKLGSPPKKQEAEAKADKAEPGTEKAPEAEQADAPKDPLPSNDPALSVAAKIAALEATAVSTGLTVEALQEEYAKTDGKMTEETLATMAKGFGTVQAARDAIDLVAGAKKTEAAAKLKLERLGHAEALGLKGGEAELDALVRWTENMSAEDRTEYEALVNSGVQSKVRMGLKFAQMTQWNMEGRKPNLVQGRAAPTDPGYLSAAELRRDIMDPRYQSGDPAFHAMVSAKMARSPRDQWADR